jgi:hypothetical protein
MGDWIVSGKHPSENLVCDSGCDDGRGRVGAVYPRAGKYGYR